MTHSSDQPNLNERVEALEVDMRDVKSALNQLIDFTYQSQRQTQQQIDTLTRSQQSALTSIDQLSRNQVNMMEAIRELTQVQRETFARIDEMQSEVRGLQTENRRIWQVINDRLGLE